MRLRCEFCRIDYPERELGSVCVRCHRTLTVKRDRDLAAVNAAVDAMRVAGWGNPDKLYERGDK
jgi:uncharacterized paraquat-inducible protein A